jgi:hypothetical protein
VEVNRPSKCELEVQSFGIKTVELSVSDQTNILTKFNMETRTYHGNT